ncbi:MAG: ParB/RepB/Spo0J family partition protein [bacterium]
MTSPDRAMRHQGLGRGLGLLIRDRAPEAAGRRLVSVPVEQLRPNPNQPRKRFDPEALHSLAATVRERGVLQPILARRTDTGYEIIAGERRWRAATAAGLTEVPVVVTEVDAGASFEISLIENLQRSDLDPIEEAEALEKLVDSAGLSHEEVAARIGKDRVTVTNAIRLLKLPDAIRGHIAVGELSAGHGRALLGLDSAERQLELARTTIAESLSVRELERRVQGGRRTTPPARTKGRASSPDLRAAEKELEQALTLKVRITPARRGAGGKIEIVYSSLDDFDRIRERLVSAETSL